MPKPMRKISCAALPPLTAALRLPPLHILPHVWYRNTWTWSPGQPRPVIEAIAPGAAHTEHPAVGRALVVWPGHNAGQHEQR